MCKKNHPEKGEKACPHQRALGKGGLCQRCQRKLAEANLRHFRAKEEARRAKEKARKAAAAEVARDAALANANEGDDGPTIFVGSIEEMEAMMCNPAYYGFQIVYDAHKAS